MSVKSISSCLSSIFIFKFPKDEEPAQENLKVAEQQVAVPKAIFKIEKKRMYKQM